MPYVLCPCMKVCMLFKNFLNLNQVSFPFPFEMLQSVKKKEKPFCLVDNYLKLCSTYLLVKLSSNSSVSRNCFDILTTKMTWKPKQSLIDGPDIQSSACMMAFLKGTHLEAGKSNAHQNSKPNSWAPCPFFHCYRHLNPEYSFIFVNSSQKYEECSEWCEISPVQRSVVIQCSAVTTLLGWRKVFEAWNHTC